MNVLIVQQIGSFILKFILFFIPSLFIMGCGKTGSDKCESMHKKIVYCVKSERKLKKIYRKMTGESDYTVFKNMCQSSLKTKSPLWEGITGCDIKIDCDEYKKCIEKAYRANKPLHKSDIEKKRDTHRKTEIKLPESGK